MKTIRAGILSVCLFAAAGAAAAQDIGAQKVTVDIPAQGLGDALNELAHQANVQVVFYTSVGSGLTVKPLSGSFTAEEAVKRLLSDTPLQYRFLNPHTIAIQATDEDESPLTIGDLRSDAAAVGGIRLAQAQPGDAAGTASGTSTVAANPVAAAPGQDSGLDEVVVTSQRKFRPETSNAASKFELPIIETPQALTVLSSEFLDIARLNDTAGVVAYTPGVELQGMGDGTEATLTARGFQINRERAFRINGLSTDSEVDLDYFAMDRVEIVRGPASSLYGEADYGATFNRVLKAPTGKTGAVLGMELGSYDFRRLEGDVQGSFGESSAVSARAVAAVQDSGTFINDTEDDRVLVAPSLAINLDRTRILLQGYYQKLDGAASDGFGLIPGPDGLILPKLPRSNNYGLDINRTDSENQFAFARIDHKLSDTLDVSFKAGHSRIKLHNISSYLFFPDANGDAPLYSYPEYKTKKDLSFDASLEKKLEIGEREQRFLLSADWRRNNYFQYSALSFPVGTINVFEGGPLTGYPQTTPPLPAVLSEYGSNKDIFSGVTALAHLKPLERVSLLLGLRYSAVNTSIDNEAPTTYPGVVHTHGIKDHAFVPRAALVYQLAPGHNAYLSYSKGIIFNQGLLKQDGTTINPETGVQYELGFKGEVLDKRVMYSASVFQITRTDVAAGIFVPGERTYYYNVGKQVHRGGEVEVIGEPIPGLNLVASYSSLDVNIRESANPSEVGHSPVAAPANSYSLFATYEMLHGPLRTLTFGGGIVGRDKHEVDSVGTFRLPGYTRVDFRASYNFTPALSLELNLQNAFNERMYVSTYASPYGGVAYVYPRTAAGRISYRW